MKPSSDSIQWCESGPTCIAAYPDTAILIARIGMASNALCAQLNAARDAIGRKREYLAMFTRDLVAAFLINSALVFEATRLARENMAELRRLATVADAPEPLLKEMGQLCAGQHPASAFLERARNQLGFHWDKQIIAKSVADFETNEAIVWVEGNGERSVHTFGFAVLNHALFPEANTPVRETNANLICGAMERSEKAMQLVIDFFNLAIRGFLKSNAIRERCAGPKRTVRID